MISPTCQSPQALPGNLGQDEGRVERVAGCIGGGTRCCMRATFKYDIVDEL